MSSQFALTVPDALVEAVAQRLAELLQLHATTQPDQPPVSPWMTFEQARTYLGFSRDTLYKLTAAKAIPCRKKQGGQALRFHRAELDQWMRDHYPRVDRLG
jgi:excisionase family DNA binding protein